MPALIQCPNCKSNNDPNNKTCVVCHKPMPATSGSQQSSLSAIRQINSNSQTINQSLNSLSSGSTIIPSNPPHSPSVIMATPASQSSQIIPANSPSGSLYVPPQTSQQLYPIPIKIINKHGQPQAIGRIIDFSNTENTDRTLSTGDVLKIGIGMALLFKNIYASIATMSGVGGPKPPNKIMMIRLEQSNGKELEVRLEGDLLRGVPSIGDEIAFWGTYSNNVLLSKFGFNQKTGAELLVKK